MVSIHNTRQGYTHSEARCRRRNMSVETRADRGETDFLNTLSAVRQQRTKTKHERKATEHEKPNE
jgi:hypothetical protein